MDTYKFEEAYNKAVEAIATLKEEAEELKESLDTIIYACEEIDNAL